MTPKSAEPGRTPLPRGMDPLARRSLAHAGVETLEQVVQLGERRLAGMPGFCPRTMAQLQEALDDHGLELSAG
jgi:hypothetical protein